LNPRGVTKFLEEAWSELKKVAWPTREATVNMTVLVILISLAIGIYIWIADKIFSTAFEIILKVR